MLNSTRHREFPYCILLLAGLCLGHADAIAADAADAEPPMPLSTTSENQAIEEITIAGERSLITLRMEIKRAQEDMFDLYNKLNSSREFDVNCGDRIVTGSLIPAWRCEPVYMQRAMAWNTQDFLNLGILPKTDAQLWAENQHKHDELNAKVSALAAQNPEFASTLTALTEKKARLKTLEQQQRKKGLNGFVSRLMGDKPEE